MKKKFFFILFISVLLAPFSTFLDLEISRLFYKTQMSHDKFSHALFFKYIFKYGTYPAWFIFISSCIVYFMSFSIRSYVQWRFYALYMTLAFIIGPGILINGLFKEYWGRPRPVQIKEFNGDQEFRPFYLPHFSNPNPSKSFPSGHASMGFYLMGPLFFEPKVLSGGKRKIMLLLFLSLSAALCLTRIAQGGHFFSDIWMSFVIMFTLFYALKKRILIPCSE